MRRDGIADVRVRVIARDLRFQNASDGTDTAFSITPGIGLQPGDINGDGAVDLSDVPPFVAVLLGAPMNPAHEPRADLDLDGRADGLDVQPFVGLLIGP